MRVNHRLLRLAAGFILLGMMSACFAVRIRRDVGDPDIYFDRAFREIDRIHRENPGRRGPAHKIHVLVYDSSDLELVQVTAPFWLVDKCMDLGEEPDEWDEEAELGERYDFDWRGLEELHEIGPGLLVEIEDEEAKILIWIE